MSGLSWQRVYLRKFLICVGKGIIRDVLIVGAAGVDLHVAAQIIDLGGTAIRVVIRGRAPKVVTSGNASP